MRDPLNINVCQTHWFWCILRLVLRPVVFCSLMCYQIGSDVFSDWFCWVLWLCLCFFSDLNRPANSEVDLRFQQCCRYLELNERLQEAQGRLLLQREELRAAGEELQNEVSQVKGQTVWRCYRLSPGFHSGSAPGLWSGPGGPGPRHSGGSLTSDITAVTCWCFFWRQNNWTLPVNRNITEWPNSWSVWWLFFGFLHHFFSMLTDSECQTSCLSLVKVIKWLIDQPVYLSGVCSVYQCLSSVTLLNFSFILKYWHWNSCIIGVTQLGG